MDGWTNGQMDGWTKGPTDKRTDNTSYRDAWMLTSVDDAKATLRRSVGPILAENESNQEGNNAFVWKNRSEAVSFRWSVCPSIGRQSVILKFYGGKRHSLCILLHVLSYKFCGLCYLFIFLPVSFFLTLIAILSLCS